MSNRRRPDMPGQWVLAGLIALGALVLAFVMGLDLVGFAVMVLVALAVAFFLRRSANR